ncbi:MAG: hypothetical protein ACRDND_23460, partial [Streptosporangiaceae bacterium]
MSYNIAISIINGKPEITSSGGDLPEGAISISGNEPTAGYKMRTLNATLYGAGQSSEYRGSAGIS